MSSNKISSKIDASVQILVMAFSWQESFSETPGDPSQAVLLLSRLGALLLLLLKLHLISNTFVQAGNFSALVE